MSSRDPRQTSWTRANDRCSQSADSCGIDVVSSPVNISVPSRSSTIESIGPQGGLQARQSMEYTPLMAARTPTTHNVPPLASFFFHGSASGMERGNIAEPLHAPQKHSSLLYYCWLCEAPCHEGPGGWPNAPALFFSSSNIEGESSAPLRAALSALTLCIVCANALDSVDSPEAPLPGSLQSPSMRAQPTSELVLQRARRTPALKRRTRWFVNHLREYKMLLDLLAQRLIRSSEFDVLKSHAGVHTAHRYPPEELHEGLARRAVTSSSSLFELIPSLQMQTALELQKYIDSILTNDASEKVLLGCTNTGRGCGSAKPTTDVCSMSSLERYLFLEESARIDRLVNTHNETPPTSNTVTAISSSPPLRAASTGKFSKNTARVESGNSEHCTNVQNDWVEESQNRSVDGNEPTAKERAPKSVGVSAAELLTCTSGSQYAQAASTSPLFDVLEQKLGSTHRRHGSRVDAPPHSADGGLKEEESKRSSRTEGAVSDNPPQTLLDYYSNRVVVPCADHGDCGAMVVQKDDEVSVLRKQLADETRRRSDAEIALRTATRQVAKLEVLTNELSEIVLTQRLGFTCTHHLHVMEVMLRQCTSLMQSYVLQKSMLFSTEATAVLRQLQRHVMHESLSFKPLASVSRGFEAGKASAEYCRTEDTKAPSRFPESIQLKPLTQYP